MIYWANAVFAIKIFGTEYFHFFPPWFYDALGIPYRLAEGIQLHFFFMWFFALNGVLTSSVFGLPNQALDARRFELSMRYGF